MALLTDNLISFWPLTEQSGTRVDSVVATGNDLTDNNTVTWGQGRTYPVAANFTAANAESLSRTDALGPTMSVGGTAFSFIAWIYFNTTGTFRVVFGKDDEAVNREYLLYWDSGAQRLTFLTWTGASGVGQATVLANNFGALSPQTWYMVAVTSDQANNKISVNAGTQDSAAAVNAGWDGASSFVIGDNGGATYWDGRIGPVGFWKRALPTADITTLYNSGVGLQYDAMNRQFIMSK